MVYVIAVTYAITRYRLMDIRVAISAAGIFIAVYSLTLGLPVYLYIKGEYLLALLTMGLLATPAPFVYSHLRRQAEEKLLREEITMHDVLMDIANAFSNKRSVDAVVGLCVESISRVMRVQGVGVYLFDGKDYARKAFRGDPSLPESIGHDDPLLSWLQTMGVASAEELAQIGKSGSPLARQVPAGLALALRQKDKVIGVLLTGSKQNNVIYSERDVRTLRIVAGLAAEAVETAAGIEKRERSLYEELEDRHLRNLSTMGAGIAHQMFNRMNMINGSLQNIADIMEFDETVGPPEKKEVLEHVKRAQEHIRNSKQMTEGLKVASRKGLERKLVSLRELFERAVGMVHQAKHKNFPFEVVFLNREDVSVFCCEAEVQEIFLNAVDNSLDAVKMLQRSGACGDGFVPRITMDWRREDGHIVVALTDNGIGFKPEDLEKAFTPHHTTKGLDKGTGLGLYVLRELVRRQEGTVEIRSEYLKGTTLFFRFPVRE